MTFWWITSVKRLIPVLTVKFINLVCLKINAFPLPLQSYDSWIVVKENPDKKMLKKSLFCGEILIDLSEVSLYSQVLLAINRYANCVKNTWICSFCWSVFPVFRLNMEIYWLNIEIYSVNLHIQSEHGKIWARKNSELGHFSRIDVRISIKHLCRVFCGNG